MKDNKYNSLHLRRKYARIFVLGHYLFRSSLKTDRFSEQIMSGDKYPILSYGQVNLSVLVGSFLGRISSYGRNGHRLCIVLFSIAGKFKTSMTRVPYNKLFTSLARSSRTEELGPRSFLYGPPCARSVLHMPRPRANIPQYGPRARLVRGKYFRAIWRLLRFLYSPV